MATVPDAKADFAALLVRWQRLEGRHDLPWQNTQDPYRIWVSEIMLQQTQVATVTRYYDVFIARFPDIHCLAQASLDDVLALWSGLGYYRRAKLLHACAQTIVARFQGEFPREEQALAELPGIGRSTAAAIAAFAFQRRAAILDGNVKRVLARVFALELDTQSSKALHAFWSLAESLLPQSEDMPAYTQGLMDLGATRCLQRQPRCEQCPLQAVCKAKSQGRERALPLAKPKKSLPLRYWVMVWISDGQSILLIRRPEHGIWASMWSLPTIESLPESLIGHLMANPQPDQALKDKRSIMRTMHLLWQQACTQRLDTKRLDTQPLARPIFNVLKSSIKQDARLDWHSYVAQSFTHFRLHAPLLHIRLHRDVTSKEDLQVRDVAQVYGVEDPLVGHHQFLWIQPKDALNLGIPRCLRQLIGASN